MKDVRGAPVHATPQCLVFAQVFLRFATPKANQKSYAPPPGLLLSCFPSSRWPALRLAPQPQKGRQSLQLSYLTPLLRLTYPSGRKSRDSRDSAKRLRSCPPSLYPPSTRLHTDPIRFKEDPVEFASPFHTGSGPREQVWTSVDGFRLNAIYLTPFRFRLNFPQHPVPLEKGSLLL